MNEQLFVSQDFTGMTVSHTLDLSLVNKTTSHTELNKRLSHTVRIAISGARTEIMVDNCVTGPCNVTLKSDLEAQQIVLNENVYIGGVSNVSPYIRSKLKTMAHFTGCIGVS